MCKLLYYLLTVVIFSETLVDFEFSLKTFRFYSSCLFLIPVTILHTTKERLIDNLTTEKIEIDSLEQ
jgi:hypothetical protein